MPEVKDIQALEESMFREYDLRGVFGRELTTGFARRLGEVYCEYLRAKLGKEALAVSVGHDIRLSSDDLAMALIEGITGQGADVYDLGPCPTQLLYFSLFHLEVDGGIMITASHNPPEYNGFKVCAGRDTIYGREIQHLKDLYYNVEVADRAPSKATKYEIIPPYVSYLKEAFKDLIDLPKIKIAIDAGNGAAGLLAPGLYRALGCEVVELYCEPDGCFPNHHPDPTVEANLKDLIKVVLEESCDFGIAFDGDADRLGAVDEKGSILWGDKLMILYATDILRKRLGTKFIGEVKCSQVMYDEIARLGGEPIMWKTGHSLIKDKIKVEKAALAGEMSGHFFFADRYFGFDDAIYAAARLIEIVKKKKAGDSDFPGLSSLFEGLPETYATPELRTDCPDTRKKEAINTLGKVFDEHRASGQEPRIRDIITVDGLRIIFEDGWGLVRASNTQPVLVLRFEANSEERRDYLRAFVEGKLKRHCNL
ncbi:MAG: phosphomannomutase/phosphoglucomutase [Actinobacteria bacterium]|nr:phosphomannomutase/phosphoglucomutase [Actinomycetota bacterium]